MARRRAVWIGLAVIVLGVLLGFYLSGGSKPIYTTASPDGKERIEFLTPTRGQQLFVSSYDMPARARLRAADGEVLGTSGAFDLSGQGQVYWDKDTVQVGTSAQFDRKTRRWVIWQ
jgi:hypothetical protein